MALETFAGKFGGVLQVEVGEARSMTSQVSVYGLSPPQMRSLERPRKTISEQFTSKNLQVRNLEVKIYKFKIYKSKIYK